MLVHDLILDDVEVDGLAFHCLDARGDVDVDLGDVGVLVFGREADFPRLRLD